MSKDILLNPMKTVRALWDLMRLEHGIMLFIAVLIGALIAQKGIPPTEKLIFAFLTPMLLESSTFALNDYFDFEVDKKNERFDRPLVRGDLKPRVALYIFFILFPLGILSAFFVNITCFIIATATAVLSVLYDVWLKEVKLLGNFYIAYIMAIPFIFGGTVVSITIPPIVVVVALIAFLTGVAREIMKDVMDFEGDKERGVKSFPRYIGIQKSNFVAAFFYLAAVSISPIPFLMSVGGVYYFNYNYLAIVLITDVMLVYTSLQLIFAKDIDINFHRKFTLAAIFVGLIAFLAGAFLG